MQIPPPLMTSEPGSFAQQTIVQRKPEIIRRVMADNRYPSDIVADLLAFSAEITQNGGAGEPLRPLHETEGDADFWNRHWALHEGRTWIELPWYFAETYFYRRLLEAVRYFQPGPWQGRDPFAPQKRAQEASAVAQVAEAWPQIEATPADARIAPLLHACLWGNRADLSNLTVRERAVGNAATDTANILINDTAAVEELLAPGIDEVAFINDNVGADSLFDLVLADHVLARGLSQRVTFHLKNQPFFVSDAMPGDIRAMIARLSMNGTPGLAALGIRLDTAVETGALVLATDPYWTRCLAFIELPEALVTELARAGLTILKGDVNYRRLLDDRHWPAVTPLDAITAYFPRPFLVLRTLKGEIIVGLAPGQAEALAAADPTWLINGRRGLIQLAT
jgi:hypothetical protein